MGNPDKIVAVGLGEVLYDHDVVTDEYTFGGAPANFADHFLKCSRLISGPDAAEVHVVSAVGDDERGRAVSAELEARGLCDGLCRVGELPTGVVDKRRDAAGVNAYEILPGAWDAMTWSDALARLAARTDVVCFGSLAQRSAASHATVVRFLDGRIRRERPTLRVFDVNLRQDFFSREVLEESMARCNILKISDEEAPRVAGCLTGCPAADPRESRSVREGAVPGIHTVTYESEDDVLEIRHTIKNRRTLALGAVVAAEFLCGKQGVYSMDDLLRNA